MITIRNNSAEELELVTHIDESVPGCRVCGPPQAPEKFGPGQELQFLGYEPGISYTIRPTRDPEIARTFGEVPGAYPRAKDPT